MTRLENALRGRAEASAQRYREATASLRVLPGALVIGAQKAGTTSLFAYLSQHPQVLPSRVKEPGFFSRHYARGERWYRSHFPTVLRAARTPGAIALEASTGTIRHPLGPERVQRHLPDVRLIALLRDPVERAWSHYHHTLRLGREPLPFEVAIWREEERLADFRRELARDPNHYDTAFNLYGYLSTGRYAEQLEGWLARFGRERLLLLSSEELRRDPHGVVVRTADFLGLEPPAGIDYRRHNESAKETGAIPAGTRQRLEAYFAPHDEALAELLGHAPAWRAPAGSARS